MAKTIKTGRDLFEITGELLKLLGLKGSESQRSGPQCHELTFWEQLSFSEQCLCEVVSVAMKLRLIPWKKSYDKSKQHIKKQRHHFANKGPCSQSCGYPVVKYRCESWTIKKSEL